MRPVICSLCILLSVVAIQAASASIMINEVAPKTPEWLELYNPGHETLDLSNWQITDNSSDYPDSITCWSISNCSLITDSEYFLILGRNANISDITNQSTVYYYVDDSSIGNGLNDGGDNISLHNSTYSTSIAYSSSQTNKSISRNPDGSESLEFCTLTPGAANNCTMQQEENENETEESEIKITDAPDEARFGDTIDVELDVYKGDTSKYAVYVYVEDDDGNKVSDKITLHFNTKFSEQISEVELQLKCKNETGTYEIIAEGLDTEDSEEIDISACGDDGSESDEMDGEENSGTTIGDFTYNLIVPNSINIGEEFAVIIRISSNAEQEQNFLVWSYVYNGSRCLSCGNDATRESNAKSIAISSGSEAEIELRNVVDDADPGTYKLKVKALQEGLKTPKEFTYDLEIEKPSSFRQNESTQKNSEEIPESSSISDFETHSFSLRKSLPYLLATACALVAIYLIIKKI